MCIYFVYRNSCAVLNGYGVRQFRSPLALTTGRKHTYTCGKTKPRARASIHGHGKTTHDMRRQDHGQIYIAKRKPRTRAKIPRTHECDNACQENSLST